MNEVYLVYKDYQSNPKNIEKIAIESRFDEGDVILHKLNELIEAVNELRDVK